MCPNYEETKFWKKTSVSCNLNPSPPVSFMWFVGFLGPLTLLIVISVYKIKRDTAGLDNEEDAFKRK